jgi:NAD+ kinase
MIVGVVTKPHLTAARATLIELEAWLRDHRVEAVWTDDAVPLLPPGERAVASREALPARADLLLVLGGDGTLLAMASFVAQTGRDVPILGINFGSLGFLTEITHPELLSALEAAVAGRVDYDRRMMLRGTVGPSTSPQAGNDSRVALNDIVFTRTALSRMIDLAVTVGDQFVTSVKADGLIVASPTGSTAYNLAAGGPIIHPAMDAVVLTPIAPHTLTNRPIVIPAEREIRVRAGVANAGAEIYATFDGQRGFALTEGEEVAITRAPKPIRLVRSTTRNYFEVLREKLKWGER